MIGPDPVLAEFCSTFRNNTATVDGGAFGSHGGAVWAQEGEVTISGGIHASNSATGFGGALFVKTKRSNRLQPH